VIPVPAANGAENGNTASMISLGLARRLRDGGLRWKPASGDRFFVADRGMDEDIFVLSDMTVEVHRFPGGEEVIGFNGTTEWALDSVEHDSAVWLPGEAQLRELLAGTFRRLERTESGWLVIFAVEGDERVALHSDAAEAYGLALLHLITGESAAVVHSSAARG
jgi:hypothetical protein